IFHIQKDFFAKIRFNVMYIIFVISLTAYVFLHSALAATPVKRYFHKRISKQHYRIWYNIISLFLMVPILIIYYKYAPTNLSDNILLKIVGTSLLLLGLDLFRQCRPIYDWNEFLGISFSEQQELSTAGLLEYVRHPLYLASLILMSGLILLNLNMWSLSAYLIIIVYLLLGIHFEEKKLVMQFGTPYRLYQHQVPMLIPKTLKLFK
ncbi:MAG: isoprenylcysteine carboxylmethyltransferase family protein, partial [Saprospiraceae bacterium]|nr:isoprenylcysteine carboxylmethyltransferase family protein [Saprospiraceae bacterium]